VFGRDDTGAAIHGNQLARFSGDESHLPCTPQLGCRTRAPPGMRVTRCFPPQTLAGAAGLTSCEGGGRLRGLEPASERDVNY